MKKGDYVYAPRFCQVRIEKVFKNMGNANKAGFTEPTHYTWKNSDGYDIVGKHTGCNQMIFAAVKI